MKFSTLFVAFAATSAMTVANAQGGDDCATPTAIAGQGPFAFDNSAATTGAEGQAEGICFFFGSSAIDNDVWFSWTADITGDATVSMCAGATNDTKIAAYDGAGCPTGGALACNDDSCGLQSEIMFPVVGGTTYTLQVGSFPGAAGGSGTMDISITPPPSPDDCATPTAIAGQGLFAFDQTTATTGAEGQAEANCLFFGNSAIDNDVWFSWTADADGTATIQTCTQTTTDTKLAVYPGSGCPADGSSLACNDDNCGLQSLVSLPVVNGTTYTIQVGTFPGATGGTGNIDISIAGGPAPEDSCATPAVIAGEGNFAFDNGAATTGTEGQAEANCVFFGNSAIDNDVWFDWTATNNGTVVISTCNNTTVDTKLAAYPGGGCPTDGSSIACNDDSCGLQSELSFAVTSGTSYLIQVGTFPGATGGSGSLDVKIFTGDSDHCSTPDAIAGQGNFAYDNGAATTGLEGQAEVLCYAFGSSAIDNDVWFSWTADANGLATVSTCNSSPDTKIAAYDGSGCPSAAALACNDDDCGLQSSISFPVSNGTVYTLQAGNFPGSTGGVSSLDIVIDPIPPGTAYCFCDGTGIAPPCSNPGAPGNGCANGTTAAGANLSGTGDAIVGADTVVLTATGIPAGQPGLFFCGDTVQALPFGDGIQCVGGTIVRVGTVFETGGSISSASLGAISVVTGVAPGDLRQYQVYYRDPAGSPCGNLFNTTNGYEIQW